MDLDFFRPSHNTLILFFLGILRAFPIVHEKQNKSYSAHKCMSWHTYIGYSMVEDLYGSMHETILLNAMQLFHDHFVLDRVCMGCLDLI